MSAIDFIQQLSSHIVAGIGTIFTTILQAPAALSAWLRFPHAGERRVDYLRDWTNFLIVTIFTTAIAILAWRSSSISDKLATQSVKLAEQSNRLAFKQICTGGNLSVEDQLYCDEMKAELLLRKVMPPRDWTSFSPASLWRSLNLKLPTSICGAFTFLEGRGDTCIGLALILATILVARHQSPYEVASKYMSIRTMICAFVVSLDIVLNLVGCKVPWLGTSDSGPKYRSVRRKATDHASIMASFVVVMTSVIGGLQVMFTLYLATFLLRNSAFSHYSDTSSASCLTDSHHLNGVWTLRRPPHFLDAEMQSDMAPCRPFGLA